MPTERVLKVTEPTIDRFERDAVQLADDVVEFLKYLRNPLNFEPRTAEHLTFLQERAGNIARQGARLQQAIGEPLLQIAIARQADLAETDQLAAAPAEIAE